MDKAIITRSELRAIVKRHGGTARFADVLGVKVRSVQYWLSGGRQISEPTAKLIRLLDNPAKKQKRTGARN